MTALAMDRTETIRPPGLRREVLSSWEYPLREPAEPQAPQTARQSTASYQRRGGGRDQGYPPYETPDSFRDEEDEDDNKEDYSSEELNYDEPDPHRGPPQRKRRQPSRPAHVQPTPRRRSTSPSPPAARAVNIEHVRIDYAHNNVGRNLHSDTAGGRAGGFLGERQELRSPAEEAQRVSIDVRLRRAWDRLRGRGRGDVEED